MVLETGGSYAQIYNQSSFEIPQLRRVRPFQPDSSYLLKKLRGDRDIVGVRMPFFGDPLPAEQIDLIRRWIESGALKN